jgi:glycosyltransferase 2 family protein
MTDFALDFNKILNRLILFIAIGVGAHIVFVLSTTEQSSLALLAKVSIWHILGIIVCMILPWMGTAARIVLWSRFLKEKIRYIEAVRVVVVSEVASALSPTAVGGTPIRAAMLINRGFDKGNIGFILTYSIIEDILFYATGILVAIFAAPTIIYQMGGALQGFVTKNWVWIIGSIVVIFLAMRLIKFWRNRGKKEGGESKNGGWRFKLRETLTSMCQNFTKAWAGGKLTILSSLIVLFAQWFAKLTILVILFDAFDLDFAVWEIYIKQWLTFVMMLFVPTPGASGGAEASFLLMFNSVPKEISFLIVSIWRLFTYYFILLIAVAFYLVLTYVFGIKEQVVVETAERR